MDFANCTSLGNNSEEMVEAYLQHLQDRSNISMTPAVVMLVVFAVVGLVGNILVLAVYSQKVRLNPTKVLIMTIACLDLVANLGAIPSEINGMFNTWTLRQTGMCKSKVFIVTLTATGGAISLCIVAIIRYRKVCCPYGWQVTNRQAVISSIVTAVIAFLFSIPYVILFGTSTRQTPCPNVKGRDCFVQDEFSGTIWPLLNNMLFLLLYFSLSISMVVMYIYIGVTAWKHSTLHGVSGETAVSGNQASSFSSGLSSEQKDSNVSDIKGNRIQPKESAIFEQKRINSMCCCLPSQATESNKNGFAMTKFTAGTTSTDNCDTTSSLINNDKSTSSYGVAACTEPGAKVVKGEMDKSKPNIEECSGFQQIQNESKMKEGLTENRGLTGNDDNKEINLENELSRFNLHKQKATAESKMKPQSKGPGKKVARRRPLGRMTAILIIISAIFVFSYLPFLTLSVYKTRLPEKYTSLSVTESAFFNFFFRIFFLNSAANPIVYSLCDLNFRRECFNLLSCVFKRRL